MLQTKCIALAAAATLGLTAHAGPATWGEPVLGKGDPVPTTAPAALEKALKKGDRVPEVSFRTHEGGTVDLAGVLEDGPVVLIFYRGGWCPFCVKQLKQFEADRERIESAGGRIVAVSTESPDYTHETAQKAELGFPVWSDMGAVAARAFGVAWANERYGKPLAKYHGNERGEIVLGVTYIIDPSGEIRWAFLEDDYKQRATPEQVIEVLAKIAD